MAKLELDVHIDGWSWEPEPDHRRLLNSLNRSGNPGHVPYLELFADCEIIAELLDETRFSADVMQADRDAIEAALDQQIRFWYQLGYDAFKKGPTVVFQDLVQLEADDTAILPREKRKWVDEKAGIITSWDDFEAYPWPDPKDSDFYPLEYLAANLPDGMAIIGGSTGVLEPVMWLMGYETFSYNLYDQPDLIEAMFSRIREIIIPVAESTVQMDRVIALWMGDDMGFRSGPLIAPDKLREFVFPIQREVVDIAHAAGIPFILHSCGDLNSVMEDLIDNVGIDARHSFEDVIEPVESIVKRDGTEVAIVGGVDMDLLASGTEEQVRRRTRQILEACAPSGAYVLGSGNSIANYIPPRNYLAMLDEGRKFNSG